MNNKYEGHTPGPWYPVEFAGFWNIQVAPYYGEANVLDVEDVTVPTAAANARLIADAPAILQHAEKLAEALRKIADSPSPANDRECRIWIEVAIDIAINTLSEYEKSKT